MNGNSRKHGRKKTKETPTLCSHISLLSGDHGTQRLLQGWASQRKCAFELCQDPALLFRNADTSGQRLLFIDLSDDSFKGAELVTSARRAAPRACIIVLAACADERLVIGSIAAGANGYLIKPVSFPDLSDVLQRHSVEAPILSPQAAAALVNHLHRISNTAAPRLTPQEQKVAHHLVAGRQDKEIASALGVSTGTVHSHLVNLFRKFDVHDRVAAAAAARRWGFD